MTQAIEISALLAASDHALITARAKHRRIVDSTVALLSSALETIEADQETEFTDYIRECVKDAINDLLKSKPEAGAWK